MATFLVVSFSERVMSFSVISCGFFLSRSSFCSVVRLTAARFFCSVERGPSLSPTVSVCAPAQCEKEGGTCMKSMTGTLRLFASTRRPMRA